MNLLLKLLIITISLLSGTNRADQDVSGITSENEVIEKTERSINILFGGDLMFDRYIREIATKKGNDYILGNLRNTLVNNDLVVVNLESPITSSPSKSIGSTPGSPENYIFTSDPSLAKTLADYNIRLVNLGNNHILNFGISGLEETKMYLGNSNVMYFGSPEKPFHIYDFQNFKVAFVSYNQFSDNAKEITIKAIDNASEISDFTVLYTHWGTEYVPTPETSITYLAHEFIDKGVDVIIGSHPHVVQTKEIYKDKTIYYSLGNFVMDQYFRPDVKEAIIVNLSIDPVTKRYSTSEIEIQMPGNGQTLLK